MRCFFYATGTAADVRRRFDVPSDVALIVDPPEYADRPLNSRPAWRKLVRSPWRAMLGGVRPNDAALTGDTIIVPDLRTLGTFWRDRGKSLAAVIGRKLTIIVVDADGEPFELPSPLTRPALARLVQLATHAIADYHRRQIRKGLASARAAGKVCHRPPFDWPVEGGRLVPNRSDVETIRDICRRMDEFGLTLTTIAAEFTAQRATLASGRPWGYKLLCRAWRFALAQGWARPRRRPWDLRKKRIALRTIPNYEVACSRAT